LPKAGEKIKAGGRVTLQVMPDKVLAATLPSALPRVGDVWEYRSRSMWKTVEPSTYTHQVTAVSEREVRETMGYASSADKTAESKTFTPDTRFVEWRGRTVLHRVQPVHPGIRRFAARYHMEVIDPGQDAFFGGTPTDAGN
jgi:hypothetical protein